MGWKDWIVFVRFMIRVSERFSLYIVIYNKVHRQLCWYVNSMNIVFTFLYVVLYNCHHPLGFLKVEEFRD